MDQILEANIDRVTYRSKNNKSYEDGIHHSNNSITTGSDSGYNSNYNISDLSTNITTYKTLLEPITEDNEDKSVIEPTDLTPTTRNIRNIQDFHITTPKCLTPSKRINTNYILSDCTPEKIRRIEQTFNETPKKSESIQKHHRQRLNYDTATSSSDIDFDIADIENDVTFSPVTNQLKSNNSFIENQHRQFERKLSENSIQSSTPINFHTLTKQNRTVAKTKFSSKLDASLAKLKKFRKTQSFSPSKYIKNSIDYNVKSKYDNVVSALPNPAKKLLDFSPQIFEKIVNERVVQHTPKRDTKLETIVTSNEKNVNNETQNNIKSIDFSFLNQSLFTTSFDNKNEVKNLNQCTPLDKHRVDCNSHLAPVDMSLKTLEKTDANTHTEKLHSKNNESSPINNTESPINIEKHKSKSTETTIDLKSVEQKPLVFICDKNNVHATTTTTTTKIAPINVQNSNYSIFSDNNIQIDSTDNIPKISQTIIRTPTKKNRRSKSPNQYNPSSIEKDQILYSQLPCTPPKHQLQKLPKHHPSLIEHKKPTKKRLYANILLSSSNKKKSSKNLDIFLKLSKISTPATELILDHLNDSDLANMYMVSKSWRKFVTKHAKANMRRNKYIRQLAEIKENVHENINCDTMKVSISRKCKPLRRSNTFPLIQKQQTPCNQKKLSDIKNVSLLETPLFLHLLIVIHFLDNI